MPVIRIVAVLLLLSGVARAGSITVSFATSSGTQSATVTIDDADIARIMAAPSGIAALRSQQLPEGDALKAVVRAMVQAATAQAMQYERTKAAKAAAETVKPIQVETRP